MNIYRCAINRKGFTLVELLIVIIIIGVLAGMMMLSSGAATDRAQQAAAEAAIRTVKSAINLSMVGANTTGVKEIAYNINSYKPTHNTNEEKLLNSILGYLEGSNSNKIGFFIHDTNSPGYYIFYYPQGDPSKRPIYSYDSNDPEKGIVKINN